MKRIFILWCLMVLSPMALAVDVVEIANFACPYCRAMDHHNPEIETAVLATGGRFVFAPVSVQEENAKDRMYYAARKMGPLAESKVKTALYRAALDASHPLDDIGQVQAWLEYSLGEDAGVDLKQLTIDADGAAATASWTKAARILIKAGVDLLPTYVILDKGEVVAVIARQEQGFQSVNMRNQVIAKVRELSSKTKPSNVPD